MISAGKADGVRHGRRALQGRHQLHARAALGGGARSRRGEKPAAPSGGALGLGGSSALGREKSGSQAVSSAGSRGVNTDRYAKGGPDKGLVVVTVTPAELDAFRKGITG